MELSQLVLVGQLVEPVLTAVTVLVLAWIAASVRRLKIHADIARWRSMVERNQRKEPGFPDEPPKR